MATKILIVDDHDVVREGVKAILARRQDWNICGEATNGQEAIQLAEAMKPHLVVLDITMPNLSGIEVAKQLPYKVPGIRILMLTMHDGPTVEQAVKKSGAHGLVLKLHAARDLVKAAESVLEGGTFFRSDPRVEIPCPEEKADVKPDTQLAVGIWQKAL